MKYNQITNAATTHDITYWSNQKKMPRNTVIKYAY